MISLLSFVFFGSTILAPYFSVVRLNSLGKIDDREMRTHHFWLLVGTVVLMFMFINMLWGQFPPLLAGMGIYIIYAAFYLHDVVPRIFRLFEVDVLLESPQRQVTVTHDDEAAIISSVIEEHQLSGPLLNVLRMYHEAGNTVRIAPKLISAYNEFAREVELEASDGLFYEDGFRLTDTELKALMRLTLFCKRDIGVSIDESAVPASIRIPFMRKYPAYHELLTTPFYEYIPRFHKRTMFTPEERYEHMHILGGTGAGKTQLIQYLISEDLKTDCVVIVIDNQRQMIPKLAKLGLDMQLISPQYPLALNIFDFPRGAHTASLLRYVLSGIMNAPLTPKQELIFEFATTLVLTRRGNIEMFQDLLEGKQFDLSGLDPTTRRFFEEEFYSRQFEPTRKEISWRVWSLLKNHTLRDMFAASENRVPLELDRKLILIDTDIDTLQDYSGMFGRFFIAQLLQKAQERFGGAQRPVYVYIDEAYYYLDENVTSMLETARKAKIGLTLAHQYLGQLTDPKISSAIMSLTSTKFAAQVSPSDAYTMAQAMHTHPEYIQGQQKLHMALYRRNKPLTSIQVPVGVIEEKATHSVPHEEMKRRYGRKGTRETPPEKPIYLTSSISYDTPINEVSSFPYRDKPKPKQSPDDVEEESEW